MTSLLTPDKSSVSSPTSGRYYGDTVTVTCEENMAYSIDYSATWDKRVERERVVECEDNSTSTEATWAPLDACVGKQVHDSLSYG